MLLVQSVRNVPGCARFCVPSRTPTRHVAPKASLQRDVPPSPQGGGYAAARASGGTIWGRRRFARSPPLAAMLGLFPFFAAHPALVQAATPAAKPARIVSLDLCADQILVELVER